MAINPDIVTKLGLAPKGAGAVGFGRWGMDLRKTF